MNFCVLGKYGRYAPKGECTNGYIIKNLEFNIAIDFGAGCLAKMQEKIEISQLSAVILTHLHFDHISDVFCLGYAINQLKLPKLALYLPNEPREIVAEIEKLNAFNLNFIGDCERLEICGIDIKFLKSAHPVKTFSLLITGDRYNLCYTSDISDSELLKNNIKGADIVIGDACVQESAYQQNLPHISVSQLAKAMSNNQKLYLAHLSAGEEEMILKEAGGLFENSYIITDFNF